LFVGVLYFWSQGFPLANGQLDALYLAVAAALSSTVISVKIFTTNGSWTRSEGSRSGYWSYRICSPYFLSLQPNLKNPGRIAFPVRWFRAVVLVARRICREPIRVAVHLQSGGQAAELVCWRPACVLWCVAGQYAGLSRKWCVDRRRRYFHLSLHPGCHGQVTSWRDFFVTLFFVSLGMSIPRLQDDCYEFAFIFAVFVISAAS